MDLRKIISQLSAEEYAQFKTHLRQKNKRHDTKNIALVSLLRSQQPITHPEIAIYGKPNKNAYYALKKRVKDVLIDFIALRSFETETSEEMDIFKGLLAARILYEQEQPIAAHKLLLKVKTKAQTLDAYSIMLEILHTEVHYSYHHPHIDLNGLAQASTENLKKLVAQENLNLAYATIKQRLHTHTSQNPSTLTAILEETFSLYEINVDDTLTFKSLFQLLELINTSAHLAYNFAVALPYFERIYKLLDRKQHLHDKQRFYHIQVLYFMANAHFRVRHFAIAQSFVDRMEAEMLKDGKRFYNRFRESALLLKSLIYNYTGKAQKALILLANQGSRRQKGTLNPDLLLAKTVILIQQEQYAPALQTINKLQHSDGWYLQREGLDWLIKKDLLTLIIHYELDHIELVYSLWRRFNRTHKTTLKTNQRLAHFIKTFNQLYKEPRVIEDVGFRESIKTRFTTQNLHEEDLFMISFFAWIQAKVKKKPLYETTLALL